MRPSCSRHTGTSRTSVTSRRSTGRAWSPWTSSSADSRAKTSAWRARGRALTDRNRSSGGTTSPPFAHFDRASRSWKTSQLSLLEAWTESPVIWPKAGIASRGRASVLRPLERPIDASDCSSSLLPTPLSRDHKGATNEGRNSPTMADVAKLLPTPLASDGRAKGSSSGNGPSMDRLVRLPTPTASDYGTNCGIGQDPRPGLSTMARKLPTPTASDSNGSRRATARQPHHTSHPGTTLTDAAQSESDVPEIYREAIEAWARILGRRPPPLAISIPRSSSG